MAEDVEVCCGTVCDKTLLYKQQRSIGANLFVEYLIEQGTMEDDAAADDLWDMVADFDKQL